LPTVPLHKPFKKHEHSRFAAASNMAIHLGFGGNQEDAHRLSPHDWNTKLREKIAYMTT
jgi:hypothetical protein